MKKKVLSLVLAGATILSMTGGVFAAEAEKEEVTLTGFVMQSVTGESGIWEGWGAQKLYDDLKIKLELDPTGNEVETKLQQYLVAYNPELTIESFQEGVSQWSVDDIMNRKNG